MWMIESGATMATRTWTLPNTLTRASTAKMLALQTPPSSTSTNSCFVQLESARMHQPDQQRHQLLRRCIRKVADEFYFVCAAPRRTTKKLKYGETVANGRHGQRLRKSQRASICTTSVNACKSTKFTRTRTARTLTTLNWNIRATEQWFHLRFTILMKMHTLRQWISFVFTFFFFFLLFFLFFFLSLENSFKPM